MPSGYIRAESGEVVWLMEVAIGVKREPVSWWALATRKKPRLHARPKWKGGHGLR